MWHPLMGWGVDEPDQEGPPMPYPAPPPQPQPAPPPPPLPQDEDPRSALMEPPPPPDTSRLSALAAEYEKVRDWDPPHSFLPGFDQRKAQRLQQIQSALTMETERVKYDHQMAVEQWKARREMAARKYHGLSALALPNKAGMAFPYQEGEGGPVRWDQGPAGAIEPSMANAETREAGDIRQEEIKASGKLGTPVPGRPGYYIYTGQGGNRYITDYKGFNEPLPKQLIQGSSVYETEEGGGGHFKTRGAFPGGGGGEGGDKWDPEEKAEVTRAKAEAQEWDKRAMDADTVADAADAEAERAAASTDKEIMDPVVGKHVNREQFINEKRAKAKANRALGVRYRANGNAAMERVRRSNRTTGAVGGPKDPAGLIPILQKKK